jgi:peptidyl-tRNA hydrolase, PTH2 family
MPRKGPATGSEYKMVLVARGELRLTAGKVAVQVAHAAVLLVRLAEKKDPDALARWLEEGQRKIALVVPTLADLETLERAARARGILTAWVDDAGFTEVPPGTRTCLGLGPAPRTEIDPITGQLALL